MPPGPRWRQWRLNNQEQLDMVARALFEVMAIVVPCMIGIFAFYRVVLAPETTIDTIDIQRLADIISLWTLVAVFGFLAVRLLGDALRRARPGWRPLPAWHRRYDRLMVKVLLTLIGLGGLILCDPLGDVAEQGFTALVHAARPAPELKSLCGYAAFLIQLGVTSLATMALIKVCDRLISWYLGPGQSP